jgi:membrane protease YdiL (CAAX protease family)
MSANLAEFRSTTPAWRVTALTLGVFLLLELIDTRLFQLLADDATGWIRTLAITALIYGPWLVAVAGCAFLLFGPKRILEALGVSRGPFQGLIIGFIGTAVFLVGIALTSPFAPEDAWLRSFVHGSLLPGVMEEVLYRAFLFGFLFRFAGWGFLPAALVGAIIFGAAHLHQSGEPIEAAGVFAITAIGAIWFAWLYVEWDYDLWVPISFHLLLNLYWDLFNVADTALGPMLANILRLVVIVLSVILTLWLGRRGRPRRIRGRVWLITNPKPSL